MGQTCEMCGRVPGTEIIILPQYDGRPAEPFLVCGACSDAETQVAS
jgi:hypothetical protein